MGNDYETTATRSWRISRHICALTDGERHLGHVVKTEQWHAYDATHLNADANSFDYLGSFASVGAARQAVESALASAGRPRTMGAGGY